MQNLVEMVTINKTPFTTLSSSGFRNIVAADLKKFQEAGMAVNLKDKNLKEVKSYLETIANKIRGEVTKEVRNDFISLSVDIASKNHRSILGIYATYIADGIQRVRCIGMEELEQRHTAKYLCGVIQDCLKEYGWRMRRIISLTTDNASNMKALVKSINAHLKEANQDEDGDDTGESGQKDKPDKDFTDPVTEIHTDQDIAKILHQLNIDDENEIDSLLDEDIEEPFEYLAMNSIQTELTANIENAIDAPLFSINGVNCAAHTVQLAVKDALRLLDESNENVIKIARAVVKFIRKDNTRIEIKNRGLKIALPPNDVETRWSSTYLMVRM